jgi:hypothetical protein
MSKRNFFRGLKSEKENMKKKAKKGLKWINSSKKNLKDKDEEDKEK